MWGTGIDGEGEVAMVKLAMWFGFGRRIEGPLGGDAWYCAGAMDGRGLRLTIALVRVWAAATSFCLQYSLDYFKRLFKQVPPFSHDPLPPCGLEFFPALSSAEPNWVGLGVRLAGRSDGCVDPVSPADWCGGGGPFLAIHS